MGSSNFSMKANFATDYLLDVIRSISGLKDYFYLVKRTRNSIESGLFTIDIVGTQYSNDTVKIIRKLDDFSFTFPKGIFVAQVKDDIVQDTRFIKYYNPELFSNDIYDLILFQEFDVYPKEQERKRILLDSIEAEKVKDTLVFACYENDSEKILRLLETTAKAQLNNKLQYTGTPLGLCAENNNAEAFRVIAKAGADINKVSLAETPLQIAFTHSPDIVRFIYQEYRDQFDKEVQKKGFGICCRSKDSSLFQLLFDYGCDINENGKQFPPLHSFVDYNNIAGIRFLINHGANINSLNKYKQTPLARAKAQGKNEVIQCLLALGAIE